MHTCILYVGDMIMAQKDFPIGEGMTEETQIEVVLKGDDLKRFKRIKKHLGIEDNEKALKEIR